MTDATKKHLRFPAATLLPIIAGLVVFACICEPFFRGQLYADYDRREQFYQYRVVHAIALERGELGLWGTHYFRGYSLFEIAQSGIFHPWRWFCARFLPLDIGVAVDLVIVFPFTFIGAFLLFRYYKCARPPALWGAALHTYSIFFLSHFGHTHMITILGHMPWMVLAYECCMRARSRYWALLLLGLGYGSMHLLAHPHTVWLVSCVVGIAIVNRGLRSSWCKVWWVGTALAGGAILAGTMIGSLALLPTLDLLSHHPRGQLSAAAHGNFSAHFVHLLQNLSPRFFAELPGDLVYSESAPTLFLKNSTASAVYFGVGMITILAAGIVRWRKELMAPPLRQTTILITSMLILFLILTAGRYAVLHGILWHVPWLSAFRTPHRYKAVVAALIVLGTTLVLQKLWDDKDDADSGSGLLPPTLIAAPFLLVFVVGMVIETVDFQGASLRVSEAAALAWGPLVAIAALFCFSAVRRRRAAWHLIGVILIVDIVAFGLANVRDVEYRSMDELVQFKNDLATRDHTWRMIADSNLPVWDGHYMVGGCEGLFPIEPLDLSDRQQLRLAAINQFQIDGKRSSIPDPLPRIRLATALEIVDQPRADLGDVDLAAVVRCTPGYGDPVNGPPLEANENIEIVKDWFDSIELSVHVNHDRIVVIADKWDKGWHCYVDSVEQPVLPLFDAALRGVIVGPGTHTLVMRYQPQTLKLSARIAAFGGLLLVLLVILGGRFTKNFCIASRS